MKKLKHLLALLLALSVLLSCVAGMAAAAEVRPLAEEEQPQLHVSALNKGALSEEFKASNSYRYSEDQIVRAIVILESAPEADVEGTAAEKSAYRMRLNKEHAAVRKAMTMPYEPAFEFTTLLNGFSCDVAYGELENIAKIDGVSAVHIANHYAEPVLEKPQNNYANQMIGNAVMNQSGYKGQGIVVAVLDTGLHTTHEAFKVYSGMPLTSTLTSSAVNKVSVNAKYLSQKVPFAYDYADGDNNVADSNGHGTHVSGTAVGYSASSDGGVIMSGGAPAAQLVAMKIFQDSAGGTSSDIYYSALEDAYTLGVDVVNMSIGAQNGFTYDSSLETSVFGNIYKRMEQAGIVMCVAAGNEFSMAQFSSVGFIGTDYTDYGTIASPAAYEGNVSIAAVQNSHYPDYALTFNGKSFLFIDSCQDGTHGWLQVFGGKTTSVVVLKNAAGTDLAMGTEADFASVNVRNKIAVVSRGEISFQEKMDFAANAGAVGIIVVNNEEGRISMSIDPYAIPAISVDVSLKEAFLSASSNATLVTPSSKSYVENPEAYQMCSFSNWGPTPMLTIDPTISSIGGNVYSAVPTGNNAYEVMSGTSMACPSAAGTFACLLEAIRETGIAGNTSGSSRKTMTKLQSLEKAVALMESTGIILSDANDYIYSVRKQGGGLANSANSSNVFSNGAYISNPIQELGDDKNKTGVYTMNLKLVNDGYETVTYDQFNTYILCDQIAQVSDTLYSNAMSSTHLYAGTEGYATVTYKVNGTTVSSITLKPTETKTVTVTITMAAEAKSHYDTYFPNGTYVEGFVSFGNADMETHATFLAFYGDWLQASAIESLSTFHMLQANYALNNEIYADGKTWAEAGATVADVLMSKFGPFYTNMNQIYVINSSGEAVNYLGGNPMDVGNENTVYRPEYNAISANSSAGNAAGFMVYPFLLRNARYVRMTVKDKNTGTVYLTDTADYVPKGSYDAENSQWSPRVSFEWKGTKSSSSSSYVASGTVVTVSFDIMLPYGESSNTWQNNALSFDVTVDSTAPVIKSAVYDSSKQLVSVTAADTQYLSSIVLCSSDYQTIHATKTFSPTAKGESCTAVFDVSGIADKNIVAVAMDYASNQAVKTTTAGTVTDTPTDPTEPTTAPTEPDPTESTTEPTTEDPGDDNTVDTYTYSLVTSASNLTEGEYILITVGSEGTYYALSTTQDGSYSTMQSISVGLSSVATAISCDSTSAPSFEFTLKGNANGFTLGNDKGSLEAYSGSDGVGMFYGTASTWTGSYSSTSKGFYLKSGSNYMALRDDISTAGTNGYPMFAVSSSTSTGTTLMHMYKKDAPAACTHANTTTTTTDATCTEAGKTVVTCKDCGEVISTTTIPALGHDYKYTSNNNGTHKITCSRCSYASSENCTMVNNTCSYCGYTVEPEEPDVPTVELTDGQYVIAANVDGVYYAMSNTFASKITGTPITVTNGKVAAADAEGYVITLASEGEGWTISDGNGNYLKYNSSTNLAKTTTAYAWTISEGTNGTWRVAAQTSGRGLAFRAKTYNTFGGYATSNCTAGSAEYFDIEILPIDGEIDVPECTHEGTSTSTTAATCTTEGKIVVSCDDCGEIISTTTIPALGHDYKYASNNDGTHKITCSRCSYASSENCTMVNNTCSYCGYTVEPEEPDVPTVELTEGKYVLAANVDGVYYAMSNTFAGKIAGTEITVTNGKVAAADAVGYVITLASDGEGWTISDGNGNYLKYNSSTNLANTTTAYAWTISEGTNGSWRVAAQTSGRGLVFRAKTYNQFGGYATSNCTAGSAEYYDIEFLPIDGEVDVPEIPECTHEGTSTSTTPATCTTAGKIVVICDDCGEIISTTTIPATGHNYNYTANGNGTHTAVCTNCGDTITEDCTDPNGVCGECGADNSPELPEDPEIPVGELTDGKYVIAANVDGVYYAMSNTFAGKIAGTPITVTDGKVAASDAEGYVIELESVSDGWTISDGNGNYLKYNSSTNLASTTTAYAWTITEGTNGTWRVAAQTADRGLVFRAKSYNQFGGYSTKNCTEGSAEYFDIELLPVGGNAAAESFSVTINHSLNLASDISINYAVTTAQLQGYTNYYLELAVPTYEGNTKTGTTTLTIQPVLNGGYYYFTMDGLTAIQMNDVIEARLYASKGEKTYASAVDSYSIGIYAYNQLAKNNAGAELKTLCAELLRYGAKAQIFKVYRTNALVDTSMTAEHKAMLTDLEGVEFGNNNTTLNDLSNPTVTWVGKALILDSKVTLRMIANLSSYSGALADLSVRVTYTNLEGEKVTEVVTDYIAYDESKSYYAFDFSALRAAELRTIVSAAVYAGNTQVSPTMQYSMDTYGNGKTGNLLTLCQALMTYSDAALAYFLK